MRIQERILPKGEQAFGEKHPQKKAIFKQKAFMQQQYGEGTHNLDEGASSDEGGNHEAKREATNFGR